MNEVTLDNEVLLKAIYEKLEKIENRISKTELLLGESKNIIATSIDSLDSIFSPNGLGSRVEKLQIILDKLTKDETLDKLISLLDIAEKVNSMEVINFIQFFADSFDEVFAKLKSSGVDVAETINSLIRLLPKLLDNKTIELLEKILELTPIASDKIDLLKDIPGIINTVADTFDEYAHIINTNPTVNKIKNQIEPVASLDKLDKLVDSVKKSTDEVGGLSNISIFDILKLLNDSDVKKQMFTLLVLLKNVGNSISK